VPEQPNTLGPLVLVGGGEWRDGATFDAEMLERSGGEVLVVPTAAAYERPARVVEAARQWFESLGGRVSEANVLSRTDAERAELADRIRWASFIYLPGGSPMHLLAVLKDSAVLRAIIDAWRDGAVIAGSSAGAMALTDPMVDPRGGAFTVGLGLVRDVAIVPHYDGEMSAQLKRTVALTPANCSVVALGEQTALIRDAEGTWRIDGRGEFAVYSGRLPGDLADLAGKSTA
jgi:cyanophycinase